MKKTLLYSFQALKLYSQSSQKNCFGHENKDIQENKIINFL